MGTLRGRRNLVRNSTTCLHNPLKENSMSSNKKQPTVRKPTKKIADSRRVRYGSGCAPRIVRPVEAMTQDSGTVRFGSGCCPAALRK
jgi:hypothetical protein